MDLGTKSLSISNITLQNKVENKDDLIPTLNYSTLFVIYFYNYLIQRKKYQKIHNQEKKRGFGKGK